MTPLETAASSAVRTAASRVPWPAWLLSGSALLVIVATDAALWAAILVALSSAYWAWLLRDARGRRPVHRLLPGGAGAIDNQALRDLIVESSRTASNDLRALRSDLGQVRGLVHDAVATLGDGFQHIHARMGGEGAQLTAVMERLHGPTGSTHAKLEELERTFRAHLGNLADIGHDRDEAVRRMDELVLQMDAVAAPAQVADAAGLAARLGQLRAATAETRRAVDGVVMRDLTAAIGAKRAIDGMLAESADLNRYLADVLARAMTAGKELDDSLGVLVRSLQFEDVVRQLLEYCDRQVAGIEAYIDGLVGLLADPKLGQHSEEQRARLMHACENYLESSTRWANDRQRHIRQTSMQAGDVELF